MKDESVKDAADEVAKGAQKDLTGRAVNEPRLQAEGRGDKLRGDARTADESGAGGLSGSAASKEQDDLNRD